MKVKTLCTATAPAKLIISGEHSILYGSPAIVAAINQHVLTSVAWRKQISHRYNNNYPLINFNLYNIQYVKSHTLNKLILLKQRLQNNYIKFLSGQCSIKDVMQKPFELLQYLVSSLIEKLQLPVLHNLEIKVDSAIPIGSGLGSSAACIVSCLRSLANLFKVHWDPNKFFNIAIDIENLQHGTSSGIDLYTTMFGGCNYFPEDYQRYFDKNKSNNSINFNNIENIILPDFGFKIVNTGKPLASTGECVSSVKPYFIQPNRSNLIKEFSQTILDIKRALLTKNKSEYILATRYNHALLCQIGVVPEKIQIFINQIEKIGGAGKICGAGSIYGDNAGIVLLVGELEQISKLTAAYGYCLEDLTMDYSGVKIV